VRTARFAGLTWTTADGPVRWRCGPLEVYQHSMGRWVATSPGCSAVADGAAAAIVKLRARIDVAAKALKIGGVK
jgi:hypothetical protein